MRVCVQGQPLEATVSQRSTPTLGGEGSFGEIEEAQSLVEATHLLNKVGNSWYDKRGERRRQRGEKIKASLKLKKAHIHPNLETHTKKKD